MLTVIFVVCFKLVLLLLVSLLASVHHSFAVQEMILKSNSSVLMRNKEHGIGFAAFKMHEYLHLDVTPAVVLKVKSRKECAFITAMKSTVFSFNFAIFPDIHGLHRCELLDTDLFNNTDKFMNSSSFYHYSIVTPCNSGPCQNGASCLALYENDDYKCQCRNGFEGRHCEIETDECASNPCLNDGICVDLINGFFCTCANEYNGTNCANKVCKPTWEQWQGSCYKFLDKFSWRDALSNCEASDSSLASIKSHEENTYVVNLAKSRTSESYLWIGLTDEAQEGTFVWTDGSALTYANWDGGSPPIYIQMNCIDIKLSSKEWYDYYCTTVLHSVCKYTL